MGYTKWVTLDFFDYVKFYFCCYSGQFFFKFLHCRGDFYCESWMIVIFTKFG